MREVIGNVLYLIRIRHLTGKIPPFAHREGFKTFLVVLRMVQIEARHPKGFLHRLGYADMVEVESAIESDIGPCPFTRGYRSRNCADWECRYLLVRVAISLSVTAEEE